MLILIVALAGIAVFSLATFLIQLAPAPPEAIRRLEEMGATEDPLRDAYKRRVRQERSERLKEILAEIGGRMETRQDRLAGIRRRMVQAGYTSPNAGPIFVGLRLVLSLGLGLGVLVVVTPVLGFTPVLALLGATWGFAIGWPFPGMAEEDRFGVRLSIGLEDPGDLIADLEAGLKAWSEV